MMRRAWVVVVVALMTMGGCSGLPASGPVSSGRPVAEKVREVARIVVPPPQRGATPEEVVRGFVRAGAAFQPSAEGAEPVGTAYLTPDSVRRWRPTSQVTVFSRSELVATERLVDDRVRLTVRAIAVIDSAGRYRELPGGTVADTTFQLEQIAGEWRISLPPEGFGIWVSADDLSLVFEPQRVYYPTIGARRLVPDVRWFPSGPQLVTALARAQLGGVPDYLRGVVDTGFPEGAQLAVDAVSVQSGVATVVLTESATAADAAHRRHMWAQLAATLLASPSVTAVSLEVQSSGPLPLTDVGGPVRSPVELGYTIAPIPDVRAAVMQEGDALSWVDMRQAEQGLFPPLASPPAALPPVPAAYSGLAVSPDGAELAAVPAGGAELVRWHARNRLPTPAIGPGLVPPTFDGTGRLWAVGAGPSGARVWCFEPGNPNGAAEVVEAPWLAGRTPVAIAVSRDATRVAVISRTAVDVRLDVAGIVRDTSGRPRSLAVPYRQGEALAQMLDVVWLDDVSLVVLGAEKAIDPLRPFGVDLGQGIGLRGLGPADQRAALPPVPGARALTAGSTMRSVIVTNEANAVLVRPSTAWRPLDQATGFVTAPTGLAGPGRPR